ncbi:hypothetical protein GJAV_G00261750 [Gymnothorax javanicus]|nr:hypothetical protein GJAV_G00261750 [Gymnothorax javanicus]
MRKLETLSCELRDSRVRSEWPSVRMSCRGGVGMMRGGPAGLQPLRATVPFQLHNKAQPGPKDAKTAEKTKVPPPKPSIRRTLSLDTIVGPYLLGQWPKEADSQGICCVNDKATQTPSSWAEEVQDVRGGGLHKRSASWGSAEHLREIAKLKHQLQHRSKQASRGGRDRERHQTPPVLSHSPGSTQTMPVPVPLTPLGKLTPRLRHSVEGLNQELEGVFVGERPEEQHRVLEVPDGHKAPVPPQRCSSGSQSDPSPALLSTSSSPCSSLSPCGLGDATPGADAAELVGCRGLCSSPPLLELSSSPRPNKSYSFQREPPEGCERVRVCEEALSPCLDQSSILASCPDPNKVNFTPHGGSAFCPVSLLKPLLPSMDILLRNLSVSPVAPPPPPRPAGVYLGPHADTATTAIPFGTAACGLPDGFGSIVVPKESALGGKGNCNYCDYQETNFTLKTEFIFKLNHCSAWDCGTLERDAGLESVGNGAVLGHIPVPLGERMAAGKSAEKASLLHNERLRLLVCFIGVFICYFYYGILQETITRGVYRHEDKEEKFSFATSLVCIQCIINAFFAKILILFFENAKPDHTRSWLYGACSLSYLGAMVSSNSALQYVNYPTQVLGKSCKPIPVMLLGVMILRKKYPLSKYLCVLLIVTGVALFMYKPNKSVGSDEEHLFGLGEVLLLLSLTLDGLTGAAQDHMRANYQTGSNHMMLNINLWSTLVLGIAALWTGEVWELLSFADRYPRILYNIFLFGLTSALGQTFIFMTVVYFGPLTCSIITTTRKFFTILGSVILFGNVMSGMQWVGTILVFLGLGLDARFGKVAKKQQASAGVM